MKIEDKVLLGLFFMCPFIGESHKIKFEKIAWLLNKKPHSLGDIGEVFYPAEKEDGEDSYLSRPSRDWVSVKKVLSSLSAKKLISFHCPTEFLYPISIEILPDGIIRAEKLNSNFRRISLFYDDHKNGIVGIIFTVLISIVVSLITNRLVHG